MRYEENITRPDGTEIRLIVIGNYELFDNCKPRFTTFAAVRRPGETTATFVHENPDSASSLSIFVRPDEISAAQAALVSAMEMGIPPASTSREDLAAADAIRNKISTAVSNAQAWAEILCFLDDLPPSVPAKEFVRAGFRTEFGIGQVTNSLAGILAKSGNLNSLKQLVTDNSLGLDIDDFCSWHSGGSCIHKSLGEIALSLTSPATLRLALELTPYVYVEEPEVLTKPSWPQLHFAATERALSSTDTDVAEGNLVLATMMQALDIPISTHRYKRNPVTTLFLSD